MVAAPGILNPEDVAARDMKREGGTKREGSTKRMEEVRIAYSDHGAHGGYVVKLAEHVLNSNESNELLVRGAICVRVLGNGELNLVTDAGRWFLFAKDAWRAVSPEQPLPEKCEYCGCTPTNGHRP